MLRKGAGFWTLTFVLVAPASAAAGEVCGALSGPATVGQAGLCDEYTAPHRRFQLDLSGFAINQGERAFRDESPGQPGTAIWADSREVPTPRTPAKAAAPSATLCEQPEVIGSPLRLSSLSDESLNPRMVWSGTEYGVVWSQNNVSVQNYDLAFARVDASGNRIGNVLELPDPVHEARRPVIVWNGEVFAVAWNGRFARIDADGNLLGNVLLVGAHWPTLAWNGNGYGLAWSTTDDQLRFVALAADGTPLGAVREIGDPANPMEFPVLAWMGDAYALAWNDGRHSPASPRELYFARLDVSGEVLGVEVRITNTADHSQFPEIAWTGSEIGVTWEDFREGAPAVYFTRLDPSGASLGPQDRIAPGREPSVAWGDTGYVLTWIDARRPYFTHLTTTAQPSGEILALPAAEVQDKMTSAWNGTRHAVVWSNTDGRARIELAPVGCGCFDRDGDGVSRCNECDDSNPATYPGAPDLCDGLNNDCDDLSWPDLPLQELDRDGDSMTPCQGDCNDNNATVFAFAPQLCDGVNNDCNDPLWPAIPPGEENHDEDAFPLCAGDCDDNHALVYPGAYELCDGVNNDCNDQDWPNVGADEADADGDSFLACENDCDDGDAAIYPGSPERCNLVDDDCDGGVDESPDTDGDGVNDVCDNCRDAPNVPQADADADGVGDPCDNCATVANHDQVDQDADSRGDACDNCPFLVNADQNDADGDARGDACDNCPDRINPSQADLDGDLEGDACDLDDGLIHVAWVSGTTLSWQAESGFDTWNSYRGALAVLRASGTYSQLPGSNPVADRQCALTGIALVDDLSIQPGGTAFFLVTGSAGGLEGGLGSDSTGSLRPHDGACR